MSTPRIASLTTMKVEGMDELQDMLRNIAPAEARNATRAAVHALAIRARDTMKRRVKKRTGDLEKSIYAKRRRGTSPDAPVSEVRMRGTPHSHGLILEFGTHKTRPQPFIVPTVEEMRSGLTQFYREQVGQKLEAALRRRARKTLGMT